MRARVKIASTWLSKSNAELENEEELLACRKIILKIVRYMKDNKMTQKDLAMKLNVSPQYINKLIHGQDLNLKVSTALKYGRILGIKLLAITEDGQPAPQVTINYFHVNADISYFDNRNFKYTESRPPIRIKMNS